MVLPCLCRSRVPVLICAKYSPQSDALGSSFRVYRVAEKRPYMRVCNQQLTRVKNEQMRGQTILDAAEVQKLRHRR